MATIDIREVNEEMIDCIIFSEETDGMGCTLAFKLTTHPDGTWLGDRYDMVRIKNKEHAQNLIKALNKAIELGWLK